MRKNEREKRVCGVGVVEMNVWWIERNGMLYIYCDL